MNTETGDTEGVAEVGLQRTFCTGSNQADVANGMSEDGPRIHADQCG